METEQRWPRNEPLLQALVTAARGGLGRKVMEHYMEQLYLLDAETNAVVESCAPTTTIPFGSTGLADLRPFEGLPFLVKDNMDVKSFHTACGSTLYAKNPAAVHDCEIVATLRELGAIPLGKTNMPPLGLDVQTFNEVYGTTCNPYDYHLTSGGSSGGSAAAVALGLAAFSVGTDWNGSLRIPAGFCGVCSLRASRGRMSLDGRDHTLPPIPEDPNLTGHIMVQGLFTKTVTDLKFLMGPLLSMATQSESHASLEGYCKAKEGSSTQKGEGLCIKQQSANRLDERIINVGVGVSFSGLPLDNRTEKAMRKIPSWLGDPEAHACATRVRAEIVEDFHLDFKQIHEAMKVFSENLAPTDLLDSKEHLEKLDWAKRVQDRSSDTVDAFLENAGFSALIIPVCAVLPPEHNHEHAPILVNGVKVPYWRAICCYVEPFSVSGNPVVTIPLCFIAGKPCGIQVIGKLGGDEELLNTCVQLEQLLHVPRP